MADTSAQRTVTIERLSAGSYLATNERGGTIEFAGAGSTAFSPVELLLAAIGGCSGIDVDMITERRAPAEPFRITVSATKVRDEHGNHLEDITVEFDLSFPADDAGDAARAVAPDAIRRSHDRICTVSRTVELESPVTMRMRNFGD